MEGLRIRFSEWDAHDLGELVEEIQESVDPDLGIADVVGAVHDRATDRFRAGDLDPDELREILHESIVVDIMEERGEDELDESDHDAMLELAREVHRRLDRLEKHPSRMETRAVLVRAFVLKALDDWRQFGVLVFAERWLLGNQRGDET